MYRKYMNVTGLCIKNALCISLIKFVPFYLFKAGIEFNKIPQTPCMCAFETRVLGLIQGRSQEF